MKKLNQLEESKFLTQELRNNKNIIIVKNAIEASLDIYKKGLNDIIVTEGESLAFCHKDIDGKQIYMFVNTVDQKLKSNVILKENKQPYVFNVNSNKKVNFKILDCENGINMELKLKPFEAVFVIF